MFSGPPAWHAFTWQLHCPLPLHSQFGDIERLDVVDEYAELSRKTARLFAHMSDAVVADFYFKIDDDVGAFCVGASSCTTKGSTSCCSELADQQALCGMLLRVPPRPPPAHSSSSLHACLACTQGL